MKKFKAESKKILDLMINSIYSDKDVFLRELISNASDALDKRRIKSLQDNTYDCEHLFIEVTIYPKERKISIKDNGIGMTKIELEENLGTIAHSGSSKFIEQLEELKLSDDNNIIGKFGVGFYSSFIVAKEVEVITKSKDDLSYKWISKGEEYFNILKANKDSLGTEIVLSLREGKEYDSYLDIAYVKGIIKKYSNYIKYPIYLLESPNNEKDKENKKEAINDQIALWKKNKNDVSKEEYDDFYTREFSDFQPSLYHMLFKVEGLLSYTSLLFIPKNKSFDFYSQSYTKGLKLYSKGVLIENNCEEILSNTFRFVKGLIDSEDISLNISREMLQKDVQISKIRDNLDKRIKKELLKLLQTKRELYDEFYSEFGLHLVYSIYENFGEKKELLEDLIMFKTTKAKDKFVTLQEYVNNIKSEQKKIYYISGESIDKIMASPHLEKFIAKDIEVLLLDHEIYEFAIKVMSKYNGIEFVSVTQEDDKIFNDTDEEKLKKEIDTNRDLLDKMKKNLQGKAIDVRLTARLKSSPLCISVDKNSITLEMEKALKENNNTAGAVSNKILELNPDHPLFTKLKTIYKETPEKLDLYSNILFNQALMLEGIQLENPSEYAKDIIQLMIDKK